MQVQFSEDGERLVARPRGRMEAADGRDFASAVQQRLHAGTHSVTIDLEGLDISRSEFEKIQTVNSDEFKSEILSQEELFLKLAGDLPKEMVFQRELLIARL